MAILGLIKKFVAKHGSHNVREDTFSIELAIEGKVEDNFVAGIDHIVCESRIDTIVEELNNQYLDDIVGRATNERIARYIMYKLIDIKPSSVKIYEGENRFVQVFTGEVTKEEFPIELSYEKARSLLFRNKPEQAIEELKNVLRLKPSFAEAHNLLGRCYRVNEQWNLSLPYFLKAIEFNPKFGEAYRNLGNAYYYLNQTNLMIPAFTRAIELMPLSAVAFNNRGFAYHKLNEFELALNDHNKAIELDSNYEEAYRDRSEAYKALKKESLAIQDQIKANELHKLNAPQARMY